jgi:hypothetical protein
LGLQENKSILHLSCCKECLVFLHRVHLWGNLETFSALHGYKFLNDEHQ